MSPTNISSSNGHGHKTLDRFSSFRKQNLNNNNNIDTNIDNNANAMKSIQEEGLPAASPGTSNMHGSNSDASEGSRSSSHNPITDTGYWNIRPEPARIQPLPEEFQFQTNANEEADRIHIRTVQVIPKRTDCSVSTIVSALSLNSDEDSHALNSLLLGQPSSSMLPKQPLSTPPHQPDPFDVINMSDTESDRRTNSQFDDHTTASNDDDDDNENDLMEAFPTNRDLFRRKLAAKKRDSIKMEHIVSRPWRKITTTTNQNINTNNGVMETAVNTSNNNNNVDAHQSNTILLEPQQQQSFDHNNIITRTAHRTDSPTSHVTRSYTTETDYTHYNDTHPISHSQTLPFLTRPSLDSVARQDAILQLTATTANTETTDGNHAFNQTSRILRSYSENSLLPIESKQALEALLIDQTLQKAQLTRTSTRNLIHNIHNIHTNTNDTNSQDHFNDMHRFHHASNDLVLLHDDQRFQDSTFSKSIEPLNHSHDTLSIPQTNSSTSGTEEEDEQAETHSQEQINPLPPLIASTALPTSPSLNKAHPPSISSFRPINDKNTDNNPNNKNIVRTREAVPIAFATAAAAAITASSEVERNVQPATEYGYEEDVTEDHNTVISLNTFTYEDDNNTLEDPPPLNEQPTVTSRPVTSKTQKRLLAAAKKSFLKQSEVVASISHSMHNRRLSSATAAAAAAASSERASTTIRQSSAEDVWIDFEVRPTGNNARRSTKKWLDALVQDPCVVEYKRLLICLFASGILLITGLSIAYAILAKQNRANNSASYYKNNFSWDPVGNPLVGSQARALFGDSVAQSSNGYIVAVGATFDNTGGSKAGRVSLFGLNQNGWDIIGTPIIGDPGDLAGQSVALSGDGTCVGFGSRAYSYNEYARLGKVSVYSYENGNWAPKGNPIRGQHAGDEAGFSLAMSESGNILAVPAWQNDDVQQDSGHVRIFEYTLTDWKQLGLTLNGSNKLDFFGFSVSLSSDGKRLAAGAPQINTGNGYVRVFEFSSSEEWVQLGSDINGEEANGWAGSAVSLSSSGEYVAVGSSNSATVRVYKYQQSSGWIQVGKDLVGQSGSQFGASLSISGNGTVIAIGASYYSPPEGSATYTGIIQVYRLDQYETWQQLGESLVGYQPSQMTGNAVSLSLDGEVLVGASYGYDAIINGDLASDAGKVVIYRLT